MEKFDIYGDIALRCGGDIYVGVVGPVRSGKSTFITKFMNELVIPKMTDANKRQRTIDELPQSAGGKTIMTTQPKFLPDEAAKLKFDQGVEANIRIIDCVGYLVDGAMGHMENDKPRLVNTPWSEGSMPFEKAAEFGTQKVISEHSTIGILVTSDGSITDIPRSSYIKAEERVVSELKALGKPFVVALNSRNPKSEETEKMRSALEEKYGVPVIAINAAEMSEQEITALLERILYEFPLRRIKIDIPAWMQALGSDNEVLAKILATVAEKTKNVSRMRDYTELSSMCEGMKDVDSCKVESVSLGDGTVRMDIKTEGTLYYKVLSKECGVEIDGDFALIHYIKELKEAKSQYDKIKDALKEVEEKGYGIVTPTLDDMSLSQPELVKQGGRYGIKLKAEAPSLHIMKVDIGTEVSPIVGSEEQSKELVEYLSSEMDGNPEGVWQVNMFGKSLSDMVQDGIHSKITAMPEDAQNKMRKTVGRIINEGKGGVICILL